MSSVDIEIILKRCSKLSRKEAISSVKRYLQTHDIEPNTTVSNFNQGEDVTLYNEVDHLIVGDYSLYGADVTDLKNCLVSFHVYSLDETGPNLENDEDSEGKDVNLATQWVLPSSEFFNLWENLFYDQNVKERLLKYALTIMKFADCGIDCNIVSCNRVILLHGPPGTGKTSLCKALAQKLSVRMLNRYDSGILVEINSHSLFSKWFSESGKLVSKMFGKIKDVVENDRLLVCVLIDEIESLAHARTKCLSENEPSDSIKVVNAVLTQIDQIKRYPNVLILTTSNMTGAIDVAFVDRADVKQYLGLPSVQAIERIYISCLQELVRTRIIITEEYTLSKIEENSISGEKSRFKAVCEKSEGLSGRSLRKIPFLAHALFLNDKTEHSLQEFLMAMDKAVEHEKSERKHFEY